ncbi:transporter [Rubritalea sp.]|uniref:transporter n=1 Tax=Rubritalea sp. TaxID=2109375 RepID=UPI003EF5479A
MNNHRNHTVNFKVTCLSLGGVVFGLSAGSLVAEEANNNSAVASSGAVTESADELSKKLANPVASMISVPFQSNFDFGAGPEGDGFQYKLNIQPVIPFSVSKDWNVITRTILPFITQDNVVGSSSQTGISDLSVSMWLSPKDPTPSGWILGVGPTFLLPTGDAPFLSTEKWSAGATGIALKQEGKWTYGALVSQAWSYAGNDNRDSVNQLFLQPFLAYLPGGGLTYSLNAESTYDFVGDQWTIPFNAMVSKMVKIGDLPTQWQLGARYYADKPENGPEWGLRLGITLLFPN